MRLFCRIAAIVCAGLFFVAQANALTPGKKAVIPFNGGTPFSIVQAPSSTVNLRLDSVSAVPITINWGDGVRQRVNSGSTNTYSYATAYGGPVRVYHQTPITRFDSTPNGNWSFNLSSIPSATYVDINGSNTVTGNLSSIPLATNVSIQGSNTVTGNLSGIPSATYVYIEGSNTVTGNLSRFLRLQRHHSRFQHSHWQLSSIPSSVTNVTIQGSNTVTGNLSSIPSATYVAIAGSNTVTGNLSSIPLATLIAHLRFQYSHILWCMDSNYDAAGLCAGRLRTFFNCG